MSSCYRPNPANLNFKYFSSIGLIISDDGCGGCIFIPTKAFLTSSGLVDSKFIGYEMGNANDSVLSRFNGSQIMFNNNSRREEFAAWSADPPPHAYRMVTVFNFPLDAMEASRWNSIDALGKRLESSATGADVLKGIVFITNTTIPNFETFDETQYMTFNPETSFVYPIIRLDRARWEAIRPYATEV